MLPSLKALQAVEASARNGSFVSAARELSVTPAAVGQLVRSLERRLGRELFLRVRGGLVPSEAGHEILPRLHAVFEQLDVVAHQLAGSVPAVRLTVSVPPSIALGWLGRGIADFVERAPGTDVSLRSDEDPVAFERDRIDVRMSYGRSHYRGENAREILRDAIHPVCSPDFLDRHGPLRSVEDLTRVPLVHTDWGPASATFPTWSTWLRAAGVVQGERMPVRGPHANSSKVALDLAVGGLGVALVQGLLAAGPLERGELIAPLTRSLPLDLPYCLTIAERSGERDVVRRFDAWFRERCAARVASVARFAAAGV